MSSTRKISKAQLESIERRLCNRDKTALNSLLTCGYLNTKHIQRLHLVGATNQRTAMLAANSMLNKLKSFGLIEHLERRIGGVRAGSGSYVWTLTDAGRRILLPNDSTRKRFYEPSPTFLDHTLAISETYVQITEICRNHGFELTEVEFEPKCWRRYSDAKGKTENLKPDLFAVTVSGDYEDSWFFEVDLSTEAPVKIVEKCKRYAHYYRGGAEQKKNGVFPRAVWIVPDEKRKSSLQRHISGCKDLHPKNIFTVITTEEFSNLITQGIELLK